MKLKSTSSKNGADNENALNTLSHSTTTTTSSSSSSFTSNAMSTSKQTTSIASKEADAIASDLQKIPAVVNQLSAGTDGQPPARRTPKICRAFILGYCGRKHCRVSLSIFTNN